MAFSKATSPFTIQVLAKVAARDEVRNFSVLVRRR